LPSEMNSGMVTWAEFVVQNLTEKVVCQDAKSLLRTLTLPARLGAVSKEEMCSAEIRGAHCECSRSGFAFTLPETRTLSGRASKESWHAKAREKEGRLKANSSTRAFGASLRRPDSDVCVCSKLPKIFRTRSYSAIKQNVRTAWGCPSGRVGTKQRALFTAFQNAAQVPSLLAF
jgi:hypothetical protein